MACGDLLESFQLNVPDVLRSVYRIRNKRGVGHIAGDVEPNFMDSTYVVAAADWVMGELVRVLHSVTLEEATILVRTLTIKKRREYGESATSSALCLRMERSRRLQTKY